MQSNGIRVLSLIPGLVEEIPGQPLDILRWVSVVPEDTGILAEQDISPANAEERAHSPIGVRRTDFHKLIVRKAQEAGVEIHLNHKVVALEEGEDEVKVIFQNGTSTTGSFVVGADGLHSNTRVALFGEESAEFTGLVQVSMSLGSERPEFADATRADGWSLPHPNRTRWERRNAELLRCRLSHGLLRGLAYPHILGVSSTFCVFCQLTD